MKNFSYTIRLVLSIVCIIFCVVVFLVFFYETLIPIFAICEEKSVENAPVAIVEEPAPSTPMEKIEIVPNELVGTFPKYPTPLELHYGDYEWYLENEWMYGTDLDILARIIMAEANTTSDECHRLVGQVIINRVVSDRYPNDFYTVVYQHATLEDGTELWQFTPAQFGTVINKPTKQSYDAARYIMTLYEIGKYYKYDNLIAFESMPVTQFSVWCEWALKVDNVDFYTSVEW